ncbi:MAG: sensor histidine kinase [Sphaerochaetaceae bacterium]
MILKRGVGEMLLKKERKKKLLYVFMCIASLIGTTVVGFSFRAIGFPETNIVLLYILWVLLISRFTYGYAYGLASSVFATGAFNYFFTEPYYTFSVYDSSYLITFVIMMATAFITSTLTSKIKRNVEIAKEKETTTNALYQLTSRLSDAKEFSDIVSIVVATVSELLKCQAACLIYTDSQEPESTFIQQQLGGKQIRRDVQDPLVLKHQIAELRSAFNVGEEFHDWPIYGRETILGLLRIPNSNVKTLLDSQIRLLHSMIESTALAMDRVRSVHEQQKLKEEAAQERYRSNLLRAISHDLRTPLTSIMGTSEMIMGVARPYDEVSAMAKHIYHDAEWLHALVENILSLTRLHEGKLIPAKQWEAVEDVVGSAAKAVSNRLDERTLSIEIPEAVLLVPMDVKLIEQVLINLLDNAIKHTQQNGEICIAVREEVEENQAVFSVADRGTGIAPEDLPKIFQMFFTSHNDKETNEKQRGIGLGLSICESIIIAHGGSIRARNRTDGPGAEIFFSLPLQNDNKSKDSK